MGQLTQLELPFHAVFAGGSESSTPGTFVPGSDWSWEWKVQTLLFDTYQLNIGSLIKAWLGELDFSYCSDNFLSEIFYCESFFEEATCYIQL